MSPAKREIEKERIDRIASDAGIDIGRRGCIDRNAAWGHERMGPRDRAKLLAMISPVFVAPVERIIDQRRKSRGRRLHEITEVRKTGLVMPASGVRELKKTEDARRNNRR